INDAILSARFITTNENEKLINNINNLTSKHVANKFTDTIVFSQSANIDYELVKLNIDSVDRAISDGKALTYKYGTVNVKKEFVHHREGSLYHVEPYALIWQNDFYYLIGVFQETNEIRHYRLDRIRDISVSEKTFKKRDFNLQEYVNQSFH